MAEGLGEGASVGLVDVIPVKLVLTPEEEVMVSEWPRREERESQEEVEMDEPLRIGEASRCFGSFSLFISTLGISLL